MSGMRDTYRGYRRCLLGQVVLDSLGGRSGKNPDDRQALHIQHAGTTGMLRNRILDRSISVDMPNPSLIHRPVVVMRKSKYTYSLAVKCRI
jgi:hypothetical protein